MSNPVKLLTYLKENSADPDTRNALALAIEAVSALHYNGKIIPALKEIESLDRTNVEEYFNKIDEICEKYQINPMSLEYAPQTLGRILSTLANGEVYIKGDHTAFLIDNSLLDRHTHVCIDDGMGYCSQEFSMNDVYADSKEDDIKFWAS